MEDLEMLNRLKFVCGAALIISLFSAPGVAEESGMGTYLCSLRISRANSLLQPASYGNRPQRVLVDLRDHPITFSEVAKDETDWRAYSEAFEGLGRTLQKTLQFPVYYTVRLLPDTLSGKQNLTLELSIQLYNKFMPSRMNPVVRQIGNTDKTVELVHFERLNSTLTEFSCKPQKN